MTDSGAPPPPAVIRGTTPVLAPLAPRDAAAAAGVLARAFADSPVYRVVLAGASDLARVRALRRVKRGFVAALQGQGASRAAFLEGQLAGIALTVCPGRFPLSIREELLQAAGCATTGAAAIVRLLRLTAYMRARHPAEPHFYLFALGVEPAAQGKGVGKALLADLHARADADGMPCYLETERQSNVRLYEGVGYRVVTDENVPGFDELRMWTMQRSPR
jgi:GNAT superfamily N-acetyltransferase